MLPNEWTHIWHNPWLDLGLLHASHIHLAYPRHSHDYYVLSVIERGCQSFTHRGRKQFTPPGGLILINPGDAHTGEAADERGFQMRCLYPSVDNMRAAAQELTGRPGQTPYFRDVRVDDRRARDGLLALHKALVDGSTRLECESLFTWTMTGLIRRYADLRLTDQRLGRERHAVEKARRYIDEHSSQALSLAELSAYVALSPYYFLRAFRLEVGMPPHAYQESLRVQHAQRLIRAGLPLAQVALEAGFSSQSHLTRQFKQLIGVTPGAFAAS